MTVVQMIGGLALGLLAACAGLANLTCRVRALEASRRAPKNEVRP